MVVSYFVACVMHTHQSHTPLRTALSIERWTLDVER